VKVGETFAMDWPITSAKPKVPARRLPDDAGAACVLLCCVLMLGSLQIGESKLNAPRFLAATCNNIHRGLKKLHATHVIKPCNTPLNLIAARFELVFSETGILLTRNKDSLCETVHVRLFTVICGSFPVLEAKKANQSRSTGKPRQRLCHVHSGNQKFPTINALRAANRCRYSG
jgi:hypothetical protein